MKQGQKLVNRAGEQLAGYPKANMRITQWMNGSNYHKGTKCWDDGGINGGQENLFAPSDIILKSVDTGNSHPMIFWSIRKVRWANGDFDYFTILTKHCNDVSDMVVGNIYDQGFVFSREGGFGKNKEGVLSPTAFGNHAHFSLAKGHTLKVVKRIDGATELENSVSPVDLFYVNDTTIYNSPVNDWKVYDPAKDEIKAGDVVKINSGTTYVSGQKVPLWVILRSHTVLRLESSGQVALLKEINSRVYVKDLVRK